MAPARTGDTLIFSAIYNCAWGPSMELGCRVVAEHRATRERRYVVSADSTFVALDPEQQPSKVSQLMSEPLACVASAAAARPTRAGRRHSR